MAHENLAKEIRTIADLRIQKAALLEALERIASIADSRIGAQPYTYRDIARAAIAQAKGEQ